MRISKSTKTSVKASRRVIANDCYLNTETGEKVTYDFLRKYWDENKDSDPSLEEFDSFDNWFKVSKENGYYKRCDEVEACGDVKASKKLSANDQAISYIKAAIDVLGKSGQKDDITKDSIANLATVMFDIQGDK